MASDRDANAVGQLESFANELKNRCHSRCELCDSQSELFVFEVPPVEDLDINKCAMLCEVCREQLSAGSELDELHWRCLQQSAWSQVPAVQVLAWRLLKRLAAVPAAQDLLDQIYLDEETLAWAEQGLKDPDDSSDPTFDSNGTPLLDGDTVQIIKDLDVKGTSFVAKRGTVVKNIRLTSNPEHVEGRVNKTAIVLKTCFLKKSS